MPSASDRIEFAPPPPPALYRAFALALLAHVVLGVALTWGVSWKRETKQNAAEAELWSAVPQQAAPREVVVAPPPPPVPVVQAPPVQAPPVQAPAPAPPPPQVSQADIAMEKAKQEEDRKKREEDLARRREADKKKLEADKLAAEKRREAQKIAEEKKQEAQKLAAERKRKDEADRRQKEEQEERRLAQQREENMKRMQGMAGATGTPSATGNALQSSGPSSSWGGRVKARVKPNIVFNDDVRGNPEALVEVRLAPDGTIIGKRVLKSSGVRAWDEAVLRALDKTEVLPRDTDGRVPPSVELVFRPKD